jgi:hypothetical protein
MNDNFDSQEACNLWKGQTTQGTLLSVEVIKQRADESRKRSQRQRLICIVAAVINAASALAGLIFNNQPIEFWLRIVQFASFTVILMQLPGLYSRSRFLSLGLNVQFEPCTEFYRRELLSQKDFFFRIKRAMIFVSLQGLVLVASAFGLKQPMLVPVGALLTLAAGLWYARTARQSSQIQSELDELRAFTQAQGS